MWVGGLKFRFEHLSYDFDIFRFYVKFIFQILTNKQPFRVKNDQIVQISKFSKFSVPRHYKWGRLSFSSCDYLLQYFVAKEHRVATIWFVAKVFSILSKFLNMPLKFSTTPPPFLLKNLVGRPSVVHFCIAGSTYKFSKYFYSDSLSFWR